MRREEQPVERPEPLRILESDYVGGGGDVRSEEVGIFSRRRRGRARGSNSIGGSKKIKQHVQKSQNIASRNKRPKINRRWRAFV